MKKLIILLLLSPFCAFAQLPWNGSPAAGSVNGSDKLLIQQSGVTKTATISQLPSAPDTAHYVYYFRGFPTGFGYFNGTQWKAGTAANLATMLGYTPANQAVTVTTGTGLTGGGDLSANRMFSLANTAVTAGAYGSATQVPTFTVDAQGRLTLASNTTITGVVPGGSAGGDLSGTYPNPSVNTINGITKTFYDPTSSIQTQLNAKAASATTLAGYGITDAYTKTLSDARYFLQSNALTIASPLIGTSFNGTSGVTIGFPNGTAANQILKWNGSVWQLRQDSVGSSGGGTLTNMFGKGYGGATVAIANNTTTPFVKVTVVPDNSTLDTLGASNTLEVKSGGIGTTQLASNSITNVKIANSTIDLTSKVTGVLPTSNGGRGIKGSDYEKLSIAPVRSTTFTASSDSLYPCRIVSGGFTATLPSAPLDGTLVGFKIDSTNTGSTNVLTIARGGSDKINLTGTSLTYTLKNQSAILKYKSANTTWYVVATDLPKGQLDLVYQPLIGAQLPNLGFYSPLSSLSGLNTAAPTVRAQDNTDLPYGSQYKITLSGNAVYFFGNSFFQSQQATSTAYGCVQVFAGKNNVPVNNQSVSARGSYQAGINAVANIPYPSGSECVMETAFNDLRQNGSAASTLNKINCAINTIAYTSWTQFAIAASAVTNTGSWGNYTTITTRAASKLSGNARTSSTSGNTLSYTTTTASTNIIIGCFGSDGTTANYGRFTVTIDGVLFGTYSPNGLTDAVSDGANNNAVVNNVIVFDGLSFATHAVTITLLDNLTTPIDYIGYLKQPSACQGIIVLTPPRMNAAGYALTPANSNNTVVDACKVSMRAQRDLISKDGRQLLLGDCDAGAQPYDPVTCTGADFIHPNDLGYRREAGIIQSCIRSSLNGDLVTLSPFANNAAAYFGAFTTGTFDYMQIGINRNVNTGTFNNTSRGASQVSLGSANGIGDFTVYTDNVNNSGPTKAFYIDQNANITQSGHATDRFFTQTNGTNQVSIGNSGNSGVIAVNRVISSGAAFTGTLGQAAIAMNTVSNGSSIDYFTTSANATVVLAMTMDKSRNLLFGTQTTPTSLVGGIGMLDGTLNTADLASSGTGMASVSGGLSLRSHGGVSYRMGPTGAGIGTLSPLSRLHVAGGGLSVDSLGTLSGVSGSGVLVASARGLVSKVASVTIANGGTGATSLAAGFITSNGTVLSSVTGGGIGSLVIGNGTNTYTTVPIGGNQTHFISNGTTGFWSTNTFAQDVQATGDVRYEKRLQSYFADVATPASNTLTDLYSYTVAANQFNNNGDQVEFEQTYTLAANMITTGSQIFISFAGNTIFSSGSFTLSGASTATIKTVLTRVSSTVVRYYTTVNLPSGSSTLFAGGGTTEYNGELTGLTLSGTNVLKCQGQGGTAGASAGDITAKSGLVKFLSN